MINKRIIKITNQSILIKIINYLTSFWENKSNGNDIFSLVMDNTIKNLCLVCKDWYHKLLPIGLKLPSYYLLKESELKTNKVFGRMIKYESVFIKLASGLLCTDNSTLLNKHCQSICSITIKPESTDPNKNRFNNISPWIFNNLKTLEITLSQITDWNTYLLNLFPVNQFYDKSKASQDTMDLFIKLNLHKSTEFLPKIFSYNFNWTNEIESLILDCSFQQHDRQSIFDLSILDNYILLGGFYNLKTLKLISNSKPINGIYSEITKKVSTLLLFGIKFEINQLDQLLANSNNIKSLELSNCSIISDPPSKTILFETLSKNCNQLKNKLTTLRHTTFGNQDLNSLISFLSSTENSNFRKLTINTSIELSSSNSELSIGSRSISSIQFLSLNLPSVNFIKYIFSKVDFNLSSLTLNLVSFQTSTENLSNYSNENVKTVIEIVKNQYHCLRVLKINVGQSDLKTIRNQSTYPLDCNWSTFFNYLSTMVDNNLNEIDLRNIWISESTLLKILESNENSNSKITNLYLSGLSDLKISNLHPFLVSPSCKLISFGVSLKPLDCNLPKSIRPPPKNRFGNYVTNLFIDKNDKNDNSDQCISLLIDILKFNSTIQHIEIMDSNDGISANEKLTPNELLKQIKLNKSIVSIGFNQNCSTFENTCLKYSIYPYFNPPN